MGVNDDKELYSNAAFISVWNAASCTKEVALHFCITIQAASNKASFLRGQGFDLKYFKNTPHNNRIEVRASVDLGADLIELATAIGQGSVTEGIRVALLEYRRRGQQHHPHTILKPP